MTHIWSKHNCCSKKTRIGTFAEIRAKTKEDLSHFKRAGVFVCTNNLVKDITKRVYFFPIQEGSLSNDRFIRDFAGHIEPDEHPCDAALREFKEESLGVFEEICTPSVIDACPVYGYDDNMYVFLMLTDVNVKQIQTEFETRLKNLPSNAPDCMRETQTIIGIDRQHILKKIKMTHHVKKGQFYYGPSLWKTIKQFTFVL